jgi:hypothetical protein
MSESKQLASIDELLDLQDTASDLQVTVERVPGQDDVIKVTPFVAGSSCLCDIALTIPKDAIDSVTATGETHHCCGKLLSVAELSFSQPVWSDVLQQLVASASTRVAAPDVLVGPSAGNCQAAFLACEQACVHENRAVGPCDANCAQGYRICLGGWPPPPPPPPPPFPPNCETALANCLSTCVGDDCCYCYQAHQRCRGLPVMPC